MPKRPSLIAFVWADTDIVIDEAFMSSRQRSRRKPSQVCAFIAARGPQNADTARRNGSR
ncbi:MAG: hypothetical protein ACT4PG_11820 [Panacagrimonas sp.]